MKKILIHLEASPHASVFDQITAYDAGVDKVLAYGNVKPEHVTNLVYGGVFTRGVPDLKNTAVFIGGTNVAEAEALMDKALKSFFGPMRLSLMFDANGSNTTAAAMVHKLVSGRDLKGKKAAILAGTGPVGMRAAVLLAGEGCQVYISSRRMERSQKSAQWIEQNYGHSVVPIQVSNDDEAKLLLEQDISIAACCGAAGVQLLAGDVWRSAKGLEAIADINAVDPLGVEGIKVNDDARIEDGKSLYGAIAIGNLKMKIHKTAIKRLFDQNDAVLDFKEIYNIVKEMR